MPLTQTPGVCSFGNIGIVLLVDLGYGLCSFLYELFDIILGAANCGAILIEAESELIAFASLVNHLLKHEDY